MIHQPPEQGMASCLDAKAAKQQMMMEVDDYVEKSLDEVCTELAIVTRTAL